MACGSAGCPAATRQRASEATPTHALVGKMTSTFWKSRIRAKNGHQPRQSGRHGLPRAAARQPDSARSTHLRQNRPPAPPRDNRRPSSAPQNNRGPNALARPDPGNRLIGLQPYRPRLALPSRASRPVLSQAGSNRPRPRAAGRPCYACSIAASTAALIASLVTEAPAMESTSVEFASTILAGSCSTAALPM